MTTRNGVTPFTEEEARRATAEAKTTMADLAAKLHRLKQHSAHTALNYPTWTEYVDKEFGMSYRRSKQLTDFFEILTEIKERTGVENPPLNEKEMRGSTPDDMDAVCDAHAQAKQNGEDPNKAMKEAARQRKARPSDGSSPKASGKPTAAEATGVETSTKDMTTGTESTILEPSSSDDQAEDLRASVEDDANTPENQDVPAPTALPVKATWTYDSWMTLTLACRDREGLEDMRDHFETLATKVELAIRMEGLAVSA